MKNSPSVLSCIDKGTKGCDRGNEVETVHSCTNVSPPHHGGTVPAFLPSGEPKWRGNFSQKYIQGEGGNGKKNRKIAPLSLDLSTLSVSWMKIQGGAVPLC